MAAPLSQRFPGDSAAPPRGLRARKKAATREALAEAALVLAERHGFDAVTAEQIATAAGVSRSTFFRTFPTKEAAILVWREPLLALFEAELARDEAGEAPLARVRRACLAVASHYEREGEAILRRHAVIEASPALLASELAVDRRWEEAIAASLRRDFGRGQGARRRAAWWAGAVLGVVRATLREWLDRGGRLDLVRVGAEALDLIIASEAGGATPAAGRRGPAPRAQGAGRRRR